MYADSGDYTYPTTVEKLLSQSHNWPTDVDQQLLEQKAENIRLEECNAWLEGQVADLMTEMSLLKNKISAIGRNLARVVDRLDKLEKMQG